VREVIGFATIEGAKITASIKDRHADARQEEADIIMLRMNQSMSYR